MSESPRPFIPRPRLSSSSGAFKAIRPEAVAAAVDLLQEDVDGHARNLVSLNKKLEIEISEREEADKEMLRKQDTVLASVARLELLVAQDAAAKSTLKWVVGLVPTMISLASFLYAVLHR
jgi:hypothetical protein